MVTALEKTKVNSASLEEVTQEIEDLRNKVLLISGHIKMATDYFIVTNTGNDSNSDKEEKFINCITLIQGKAEELEKDIYTRLDELDAKLALINKRI